MSSLPFALHSIRHPALRRIAALAAALALAAAAPLAHAEKADKQKPINYSADHGDVNYQTKVGTLSGNVVVTQGTMTIHADRIVIRQNPDNSVSVSAFGNPVSFRQKRDGYDEYFDGYAQHAEYDGSREFLELFDRALLRRGQDEIRSNYITYNVATEVFKAEGRASPTAPAEGNPGARVRGVFQPKAEGAPGAGKGDKKDGGADAKDAAAASAKSAPKDAREGASAAATPALQPAPELASPAAK
jgi:lipopolysaccharide export system protein LptA